MLNSKVFDTLSPKAVKLVKIMNGMTSNEHEQYPEHTVVYSRVWDSVLSNFSVMRWFPLIESKRRR